MEILNLSGNQIAQISNDNFEDFADLINLSLSKNTLHTIEFLSFVKLRKLSYLDLSENRLESIDNRIVENNEALIFLDLSQNKFMMLEDSPLLISKSLEFLSLRGSHLTYIYESFFSDIANVLDLDISNNLLITLKSSTFYHLQKLQFINLEYNSFTCDHQTDQTLQYFKARKVFVKIDKCIKNTKKPMFEKMILAPNLQEDEESKEDIEIELIWGNGSATSVNSEHQQTTGALRDYFIELKNNLEDERSCKSDEFDSMLCECRQNYITLYEMANRTEIIQKENIEFRMKAIFHLGVLIGAISGCVLFYCGLIIKSKCAKLNRKRIERQHLRDQIVREYSQEVRLTPQIPQRASPIMRHRTENLPSSPATNSRRQFYPQSPLLQQQNIRNEYSATANLLHKLFRNRDISVTRQEFAPTAVSSSLSERRGELPEAAPRPSIQSINLQSHTQSPTNVDDSENDSDSEYLSINESIILEPDRSSTPPPAYMEIFEQ